MLYFDTDQMSWFARICVFVNPKLMFGEIGLSIQHPSCQHNTIGLGAASTNYTVLPLLFKMQILQINNYNSIYIHLYV